MLLCSLEYKESSPVGSKDRSIINEALVEIIKIFPVPDVGSCTGYWNRKLNDEFLTNSHKLMTLILDRFGSDFGFTYKNLTLRKNQLRFRFDAGWRYDLRNILIRSGYDIDSCSVRSWIIIRITNLLRIRKSKKYLPGCLFTNFKHREWELKVRKSIAFIVYIIHLNAACD